jgi:3-oxoadipate enol-lactonase
MSLDQKSTNADSGEAIAALSLRSEFQDSSHREETSKRLQYFTTGDGVRIAYQLDGPANKPVLVLANSIGTTYRMWDAEIPKLTKQYRVVRYDYRGHGTSDVPPGAYSIDRFGRDVVELLDALDIKSAHFLGLSLGGFVGQWLGIHATDRINRLVLANTSSYLGPAHIWDGAIAELLSAPDMKDIAETFLGNWFPRSILEGQREIVEVFRNMLLNTDRQGLAGTYALVRDTDLRRTGALIENPTLVIAGEFDTVTAASHSYIIAKTLPNAKLKIFPAVHLTNVEFSDEFVQTVTEFLEAN